MFLKWFSDKYQNKNICLFYSICLGVEIYKTLKNVPLGKGFGFLCHTEFLSCIISPFDDPLFDKNPKK